MLCLGNKNTWSGLGNQRKPWSKSVPFSHVFRFVESIDNRTEMLSPDITTKIVSLKAHVHQCFVSPHVSALLSVLPPLFCQDRTCCTENQGQSEMHSRQPTHISKNIYNNTHSNSSLVVFIFYNYCKYDDSIVSNNICTKNNIDN